MLPRAGCGQEPPAPGSVHRQMTTLSNLLARKEKLIARLREADVGDNEREEIERLLSQIETALSYLDPASRRDSEPD